MSLIAATRRFAALLLALFVAGMVAHVGHHLVDPDCGETTGPLSRACVACATLHGGADQGPEPVSLTPERTAGHRVVTPDSSTHAATARGNALSRAPPLG
jgi:hypothetical protein